MKKRSLVLCMAAGLLASLAFATPSQAGSTLVTTTVTFSIVPSTVTIQDVFVQYGPVDPISALTLGSTNLTSAPPGLVFTNTVANPDTVTFTFDAKNAGHVTWTFETAEPPGMVGALNFGISSPSGSFTSSGLTVSVTAASVPEPASMALLGIGMTGFLAFRRFFKKTSVV